MISCPFCNAAEFRLVYETLPGFSDLSIVQCKACGHSYTHGKRSLDTDQLYNDEVYKVVEVRKSIYDRILNREYSLVIKTIKKLMPGASDLLDFGSGKGHFLNLAKKAGYNVKGVETSVERAEYAKTIYQVEIHSAYYKSGNIFGDRVDIITLFHVLEHLAEPRLLLKELINGNLNNGGLLVIEVPNFKSLQSRIAGRHWMHLDPKRHISHFTPGQLDKIALELNLKVVKTSFFSFHLGVLGLTDAILKKFGYRKNIIYELKIKKPPGLIILILILLPFTFILEAIAAVIKKGGIVRKYMLAPNDLS